MKQPYDSTGQRIKIGDRVRFRGKDYTIESFSESKLASRIQAIQMTEPVHTDEQPTEFSVDLLTPASAPVIRPKPGRVKTCSICQATYTGFGNNAWPVNSGRCCDDCNALVVIPARINRMVNLKESTP